MNLLRLNIWRKCILAGYVLSLVVLFAIDWGYHFNVGHVVRISVGAIALWLAVDRL
ncbi:hypothetical protein [Pseudodesulfovibrio sp.]|uniref:hypothetical protein n=1 Tax=Pseudodesulfovibrio sp. TaxID=2035812 RepID=UPI00261BDA64|nr:hypothetical protein [Pseudodesulfovibrio sp.]MDD3312587.1 hypothetical protein [Pseudodesulfovibrio sp.]